MKRFSFLAALFGFGAAAKAQEPGSLKDFKLEVSYCPPQWTVKEREGCVKPLNNQCPVCGMMEPPFDTKTLVRVMVDYSNPPKTSEILTRCKRCNNAFWQDTE